jgi:hypothetical protein
MLGELSVVADAEATLDCEIIGFLEGYDSFTMQAELRNYFLNMNLFLEVESAVERREEAKQRGAGISKIELSIREEEGGLPNPKVSFDTGIDLTGLAVVVSDWFDADSEGEEVAVLGSTPNSAFLVHHSWAVGLLVMLQNLIVMDSDDAWHDIIDLSTLKLSFPVAEDYFAGSVDLVHDSAVFTVKLQENNSVFLVESSLSASSDFFLKIVLCFKLTCLLHDAQSLLFIVEHFDKVSGIKVVAFYIAK